MLTIFSLQPFSRKSCHNLIAVLGHIRPKPGKGLFYQFFSHYPDLIINSYRCIGEVRVKGHCQVGRQGPGGGCPDQGIYLPVTQFVGC